MFPIVGYETQIENEYGNVASSYGAPGKAYTKWAAQMAVGLNTGVPWIMCQQSDAPDPVVSSPSLVNIACLVLKFFLLYFLDEL